MIININCKTGMQLFLADNSVDAIVCDPPYELGFMGKSWDSTGIAYDVDMWAEALRVLKPGGHLLAFSGSRTYHRMAVAIEDAGFDIRDQIMWLYGSGFPKSLDVSKAIDKARIEDVEPVRVICRAVRAAMDACDLKSRHLTPAFDNCHPRLIDHWAARDTDSQPTLPTWEQWQTLRLLLPLSPELNAEVWRLNGRKGQPGDTYQNAEIIGQHAGVTPGFTGMRFETTDNNIRELSDAARQWEGWGTALKPAHEPICVARKPLIGTVAANILAHGTGAINIDACRVATAENDLAAMQGRSGKSTDNNTYGAGMGGSRNGTWQPTGAGRWPANVITDGSDEVVAVFPAIAGSNSTNRGKAGNAGMFGNLPTGASHDTRATGGGAARFFKTCKQDDTWLDLNLPHENAIAAAPNLYQQKQSAVSALEAVVKSAFPAGLCAAVSLSVQPTTSATGAELKRLAESLMQTILNIDCGFWHESQPARLSLSRNHVKIAAHLEPTGTTTITANHWKLDGSADSVTFNITLTSSAAGAKDCAPSSDNARYFYCAKASTAERGAGNNHPTVKPIALMRYLVRLVTPPGGLVLDPFTGSGTTAVAAKLEGAQFMGFELSPEYAAIATARYEAAA